LHHKHGLTQTELAGKYEIAWKTVHTSWTRLEPQPIDEAIVDDI
jgi:hypothetical protein